MFRKLFQRYKGKSSKTSKPGLKQQASQATTIGALWLQPPLAFARLGNPDKPLEAFHWGPNDEIPDGTGKTTILASRTLILQDDDTVRSEVPKKIVFGTEDGMKAVCPFFELHGCWRDAAGERHEGPITKDVLNAAGWDTQDLVWDVKVANLKPFSMCQDPTTRIDAQLEIRGDDFQPKELRGISPAGLPNVLVPEGKHIPLGKARLIKPSDQEPELRLRFYPPRGEIYGPTNLRSRVGKTFTFDDEVLLLNKHSIWCRFKPSPVDLRGLPGNQYAQDVNGLSLGMVDDTSDGIITCRIRGTQLSAAARIVVAPPHLAPDRRHFVSIADGLKDRTERQDVYSESYYSKEQFTKRFHQSSDGKIWIEQVSNHEMAQVELHDLMERVLETMWLINLDAYNHRVALIDNPLNAILGRQAYNPKPFGVFETTPTDADPLPLVDNARKKHRRLSAFQILETHLRQRPGDLDQLVRLPLDPNLLYDKRMPALMHGSYAEPLSLTRRQFDLLAALVARLRAKTEEDS